MKAAPATFAVKADMERFCANLPDKNLLRCFHPVQCPMIRMQAEIQEIIMADYSVLGLLILRLFDAGITDPKTIASLSGMTESTVNAYLEKEIYLLQHIEEDRKTLTTLGKNTIQENHPTDPDAPPAPPKSQQYYNSIQHFYLDAVTGTILPSCLAVPSDGSDCNEDTSPDPNLGSFLPPPETLDTDDAFFRELSEHLVDEVNRELEAYRSKITGGDLLKKLRPTELKPLKLFYRWMYLVHLEGMRFPMLVASGKHSAAEKYHPRGGNPIRTLPISISQTDAAYLKTRGISFPDVLIREDRWFLPLASHTRSMTLTRPDNP